MSNSTGTPQGELLNIQNSAEETPRESSSLIKNEAVEGTPFRIIGTEGKWFLAMGRQKVTHDYETEEEAIEALWRDQWFIMMRMTSIIVENMIETT